MAKFKIGDTVRHMHDELPFLFGTIREIVTDSVGGTIYGVEYYDGEYDYEAEEYMIGSS